MVGTKNNLAIRDFVNQQCVPNLFAATGSPAWGNHDFPWLIGSELGGSDDPARPALEAQLRYQLAGGVTALDSNLCVAFVLG